MSEANKNVVRQIEEAWNANQLTDWTRCSRLILSSTAAPRRSWGRDWRRPRWHTR
jgi:hypothetical protein